MDETTIYYYIQADDDSAAVMTDPPNAATSARTYTVGNVPPGMFKRRFTGPGAAVEVSSAEILCFHSLGVLVIKPSCR